MSTSRESSASDRQRYGGQAVVEGVMMRSPRFFAVACRRESDGEVVVELENVESVTKAWQWLNKPFLRGILALVDALYMGTKALMYSANVQTIDATGTGSVDLSRQAPDTKSALASAEAADLATGQGAPAAMGTAPVGSPPINGIVIGGTVFVSLLIGMGMFWVLPTMLTEWFFHLGGLESKNLTDQQKLFANLSDGGIRIVIFLTYIALISQMKNVRRVFMYHGAEHKAINALEAGDELTLENARKASRIHPRCGTNFIFIVLIVSIFVFALFGRPIWYVRIPLHLASVMFVVGIAFEVLKFAGKYRKHWWARALIAPGLATQYLTTRVPDDSMIEVALASLQAVWDKEHEADAAAAAEVNDASTAAPDSVVA
ncbi:MAG TPA: DUF1385 domain-containing protein [Capsulimonadaceae bacterium]|jgi:uncharacterized protein YqhQ